jgi:hypothetical protein
MSKDNPKALLIVADRGTLLPGEVVIQRRLERLNYEVAVRGDKEQGLDVRDVTLMVVSSSVVDPAFGEHFRDFVVPIIVSSKELYIKLGMCLESDVGEGNSQSIEIIHPPKPGHPMTATFTGTVKISSGSEPMNLSWAQYHQVKDEKRVPIAALPVTSTADTRPSFIKRWIDRVSGYLSSNVAGPAETPRKKVLFGCRVATPMFVGSSPAKEFPAKRVAFPCDYRRQPSAELLQLFDEAAGWAVGNINIRQFAEVFRDEWKEIYRRRKKAYAEPPQGDVTGLDGKHAPENLVGLAFSGGGIRSATFCLGVLQALHELKLLRIFDYFSTVSGGGYLGGWWSAWLSRPGNDRTFPIFPAAEKIEPARLDHYRWRSKSTQVAEGSLSAWRDPIHHLRLFANYLTPRTGGFSADTWRAIGLLSRNLLLTWLMLLPLLLTFVIAAQTPFMLYPKAKFLHTHWIELQRTVQQRNQQASFITDQNQLQRFNEETETKLEEQRTRYRQILAQRALFIAVILLSLIGWIGLMFIAFMRSNSAIPLVVKLKDRLFPSSGNFRWALEGSFLAHLVGAFGVAAIASVIILLAWPAETPLWQALSWLRTSWWGAGLIAWAIVGAGLVLYTMPWRPLDEPAADAKTEEELRRGVWRNQIGIMHSRLLVILVMLAVLLVFAGYGHEIFDYLWRDPEPRKQLLGYVAKVGGWGAIVAAIFGTIFSAIKSAPSGGHDSGDVKEPPAWQKAIFVLTPLLVIITLMVMGAWVAHEIFGKLNESIESPEILTAIIMVGAFLSLFFALFEIRWQTPRVYLLLTFVSSIILGAAFLYYWQGFSLPGHGKLLLFAALVGSALLFRLGKKGDRWSGGWSRLEVRLLNRQPGHNEKDDKQTGARWFSRIALIVLMLVPIGVWWFFADQLTAGVNDRIELTLTGVTGMALCLVFVFIEAILGKGDNRGSLILLTSVYLVSLILLLVSFHSTETTKLLQISLGFFATAITWVIALGWMADPNAISMYGFYKGRLVRAYLGASNPKRFDKLYEITETAVGDDVLLTDMKNCERSAPYHLLNTTLNLTGGRDLATAQRSSAMFVLSKLYCGSFRTGFQRSERYANGSLSLGMAVATSGAAVSPGMGAGKTTASQAMLMTLLNLRLGYWAPSPGGEHWESRQTRLWPLHTLREFLSQTNDLSSYCYLTDGGHFDNLGIYSLVERGCRYIVAVDAVADPEPCFSDLGNAIRRCRIDFNADIDLDITLFIKSKDNPVVNQHYVVGQIVYSEEHVKKLGWNDTSLSARTGVIVYIKSSLLRNEKELRADVRQYGIENSAFPQQSTINQWFDEAQFESYRQLGKHCCLNAFDKVATDPHKKKREELPGKEQLSKGEQTLLDLLQTEEKLFTAINGRNAEPLSPNLIKALFNATKPNRC